jgi:hypothetical protein
MLSLIWMKRTSCEMWFCSCLADHLSWLMLQQARTCAKVSGAAVGRGVPSLNMQLRETVLRSSDRHLLCP